MADSTLYLALTGSDGSPVQGESTVKGFEQQIQLTSLKWGGEGEPVRDWGKSNSKKFAGRHCKFSQMTLTRDYDLASTVFYGDMNNPTQVIYKLATITAVTFETGSDADDLTERSMGGVVVFEMELKDVRIHSIGVKASQKDKGANVTETLTLSYSDIVLKYYPPLRGEDGGKRAKSPKSFQAQAGSADPNAA